MKSLLVAGLIAMLFVDAAWAEPVSTEIEAPGPSGPLKGTLTMPAPGAPVVLILPGSGPTDRDGNSPAGVAAAPYRLLAEGLAARGVGTLRIDKRGLSASRAAVADGNAVTIADYVTDTRAWITAARAKTGARCVWLLGHSEGGLIALATAQTPNGICGLVLVATPGRRMGDVLRDQLRANPANAPLLNQAFTAIAQLEAGHRFDTANLHPALALLFRAEVQRFLIDAFAYDPAKLIAGYAGPLLIVQGTRDIQVGEEDARKLKAADAPAELALLKNVNHVLKTVHSDDRAVNAETYTNARLPLAPEVVPTIADFIAAHPAPR